MRNNGPLTQVERFLEEGQFILSKTDLKGIIEYVNPDFCTISGYREDLVQYISSLIDVYIKIYNLEIDKVDDFDPVDFDPDREIDDTELYRL